MNLDVRTNVRWWTHLSCWKDAGGDAHRVSWCTEAEDDVSSEFAADCNVKAGA